jgi:hypothetical protein
MSAFNSMSGRYKVLYPIKKMILFTEENNEIIEKSILQLKLHREDRMFFHLRYINNTTISLENIRNATDVMILQAK